MRKLHLLVAALLFTITPVTGAMAAGAVTVSVSSGMLVITGDAEDNKITISDADGDSKWEVKGSGGTLVNGAASVVTDPVTSSVSISLNEGNDSLKIQKGSFPAGLGISMGPGDDKASLKDLTIALTLGFGGDAGNDKALFSNITINDPGDGYFSTIAMDYMTSGDDSVKIKNFVGEHDLAVETGDGDDKISVSDSDFGAGVSIHFQLDTGGGNDKAKLKSIQSSVISAALGDGETDSLAVLGCTSTNYNLDGGAGASDKLVDKDNSLGAGVANGFEK